MPITLVVEDGTGLSTANSYASAAQCDAYHAGHLYSDQWDAATVLRNPALVMATRLIDSEFRFHGRKASSTQALQWPRCGCLDPDAPEIGGEVSSSIVPPAVVTATCEMARLLIFSDRTGTPAGEGLKYYFDGATQTGYDKSDRRPVLSVVVQNMLSKFGCLITSRCQVVPLVRA
jgi:hypothetical protein